jgi:hypothetical protein
MFRICIQPKIYLAAALINDIPFLFHSEKKVEKEGGTRLAVALLRNILYNISKNDEKSMRGGGCHACGGGEN